MTLFIYHENCADGFGAALAAHILTNDRVDGATVQYLPARYGSPAPDTGKATEIVIADFSYPLETMLELHRRHPGKVTLLDHHRTALERLAGKIPPNYTFDLHRSGARLAWDYWAGRLGKPATPRPPLIDYIEDRDLWQWRLPHSQEVSAALKTKPYELDLWRDLTIPQLVKEGTEALAAQRLETGRLADTARLVNLAGHQIPAVRTRDLTSEVCHELLRRFPETPFAAAWHITDEGQEKWSLRSRPEFDVSRIAQGFGGGGHAQAAGFSRTDICRDATELARSCRR